MATGSTKQLIDIADIRENVVFLKNGSLRALMEVSSINFELRSEEEQNAIIQNFQRFLNSIDFPLQIVIQSRQYNIDEYLKLVEEATANQTNELLKIQATEYGKFIKELSALGNIMSKKFYIVIPFYVTETANAKGFLDMFTGIFKTKKVNTSLTEEQFTAYKTQLIQRSDLVFDGLVGLGLKTRLLEQEELQKVFMALYNAQ